MVSELSEEPVLSGLAARISADEVRHYKHFYRYFLRYRALERPGRAAVLRTLWNRLAAVETEDALCAFEAVFLACNPDRVFQRSDYDSWRDDALQLVRRHLPHEMARDAAQPLSQAIITVSNPDRLVRSAFCGTTINGRPESKRIVSAYH
jgi:hypothetical protein